MQLLRRAIEKRPLPGTSVPTYGTNFEPRYFPYLRLAEAHLLLGAEEDARKALETSVRLGVEPREERAALEARVRAAIEAKRPPPGPPPPVAPTPTPGPASVAPPVATPAPEPVVVPTATPVPPPATPESSPAATSPLPRQSTALRPPPGDTLRSLEISSDPPGAQVFLDDVPVGRTDPETGRLRLMGLAAGRHRVRLSSEGRDDLIRDLDLVAGSLAWAGVLRERTAPSPPPQNAAPPRAGPSLLLLVGLGLVAALILVLWVRSLARLPRPPAVVGGGEPGTDEGLPMPFGEYRLIRRIGKGGMAAVYEATRRGEVFALKRPLAGLPRRPPVPRALPARSGARSYPSPPQHRPHPGPGPGRKDAVLRHGARRGRDTARPSGPRRGPGSPAGGECREAGGRGPGLRSQQRGRPPGPEALEHHAGQIGSREGHGLRDRARPKPGRADHDGLVPRHPGVRRARGGGGHHPASQRPLLARRRLLRDADREPAVSRRDGLRGPAQPRHDAASGALLPQVHAARRRSTGSCSAC